MVVFYLFLRYSVPYLQLLISKIMKKIEPYAYFCKQDKIYLLEFSLEQGKYKLLGQYDHFYSKEGCVVLTSNDSSFFSVLFETKMVYCKAVQGKFVGFGEGFIYFEGEDKKLFTLSEDRNITEVARPCSVFSNTWENMHSIFKLSDKMKVQICVK